MSDLKFPQNSCLNEVIKRKGCEELLLQTRLCLGSRKVKVKIDRDKVIVCLSCGKSIAVKAD